MIRSVLELFVEPKNQYNHVISVAPGGAD